MKVSSMSALCRLFRGRWFPRMVHVGASSGFGAVVGLLHNQGRYMCYSLVRLGTSCPYEGPSAGNDAVSTNNSTENAVARVKRLPLSLIEEIPPPQCIYSDLELVMMAWCEEHARRYAIIMTFIRLGIFVLLMVILYVFYRTQLSSERVLRGVDHMPSDLRIGSVVYFDVTENGVDIGRIVIGLLNENCPLYCEYFHRRCTGSGETGDSFRGMCMSAIVPNHCLIFGDGRDMTHDVPGFNPHYLPTEFLPTGSWRGALSSIAYGQNKESPNFAIHISSGDYGPQVFGLVIGGFDVVERVNSAGSTHGNASKKEFVVTECGELCTLAKSHIVPMPWKLYEGISHGYDEEKFGQRANEHFVKDSGENLPEQVVVRAGELRCESKSWWKLLW